MSNYKEQLQQNNNELSAILEIVNNLPEAGGGGGGIAGPTCLVTIVGISPGTGGIEIVFCDAYGLYQKTWGPNIGEQLQLEVLQDTFLYAAGQLRNNSTATAGRSFILVAADDTYELS